MILDIDIEWVAHNAKFRFKLASIHIICHLKYQNRNQWSVCVHSDVIRARICNQNLYRVKIAVGYFEVRTFSIENLMQRVILSWKNFTTGMWSRRIIKEITKDENLIKMQHAR